MSEKISFRTYIENVEEISDPDYPTGYLSYDEYIDQNIKLYSRILETYIIDEDNEWTIHKIY